MYLNSPSDHLFHFNRNTPNLNIKHYQHTSSQFPTLISDAILTCRPPEQSLELKLEAPALSLTTLWSQSRPAMTKPAVSNMHLQPGKCRLFPNKSRTLATITYMKPSKFQDAYRDRQIEAWRGAYKSALAA